MKAFSILGMRLLFEAVAKDLDENMVGHIIEFDDKLVKLLRVGNRAGSLVWFYVQLGESVEHYSARIMMGQHVVERIFVRGEPTTEHPAYPGNRLGRICEKPLTGSTFERADALIPRDEALRYRNLWGSDSDASVFVHDLIEYNIETPIISIDKFEAVRLALGAKVCRNCGRLHMEAGEFCSICTERIERFAMRIDGKIVPKVLAVKRPDGSFLPIWEAHNESIVCSVCGKTFTFREGGTTTCAECTSKVKMCAICGSRISMGDGVHVEGVGDYHKSCAKKPVVAGYHTNSSHSSPTFFGTPTVETFPLFMGIELEGAGKESRLSAQMPAMAEHIIRTRLADLNVEATRDGSLPGGGIEIISQPMTIEMWRDTMPRWKDALSLLPKHAGIYGHDARCAGLHVHVSKKAFQMYEPLADDIEYRDKVAFGRLIVLFARFADEFLFISRRNPSRKNEYARAIVSHSDLASISEERFRVEFARLRERAMGNSGHYTEINISPRNTMEFRLFRSTFNTETLLATLEFVHGLCWFVSNNDMTRCRTITFDDLIATINKPILTAYVARVMARRSRTQDDGFEGEE
ncbi:MAG TPA: hypothetical protein VLH56_18710 [Dissulfurispiraceae bacterium]|nr:hypothetical protein [Dissulfurispiraceae bacterium]